MNETTTSESAYTESVAGFGNESALFGRGGQLATLGIALASARNGVTEVVVVSGPSGLGTSSLLKTFVGGVSDAVVGFGSYSTDVDSAVGARNGLMEALGQVARSVAFQKQGVQGGKELPGQPHIGLHPQIAAAAHEIAGVAALHGRQPLQLLLIVRD